MNKFWLSVILAFALLLGKQGALLHELSHLAPAGGAPGLVQVVAQAGGDEPAGGVASSCLTCLAFDQIGGAAPLVLPSLPLLQTREHWALVAVWSSRPVALPARQARGPPTQA